MTSSKPLIKIILQSLVVLISSKGYSQNGTNKIDTIFYRSNNKKIQTITKINGNERTETNYYQNGGIRSVNTYLNDKMHGINSSWYENTQLSEETVYQNGALISLKKWSKTGEISEVYTCKIIQKDTVWRSVPDGQYSTYFSDGKIKEQGTYTLGKTTGEWVTYYGDGTKKGIIYYNNDGSSIQSIVYSQNGKLISENNYSGVLSNNKPTLHGKQKYYFETGNKKEVSNYTNGFKDGTFQAFYENGGKKSKIEYKAGYRSGTSISYFENGKVASKFNYTTIKKKDKTVEVKDGKQMIYYETGGYTEVGSYKLGLRDGLCREWYNNGKEKSEIYYKNDLVYGIKKEWYPNGKIMRNVQEFNMYDTLSKRNIQTYEGKYELYYENGKPKVVANFKDSKKNGIYIEYYDNGQKEIEKEYMNGLETGKTVSYYKNTNNPSKIENHLLVHHNDTVISVLSGEYIEYYENGIVTVSGIYQNNHKDGLWVSYFQDGVKKSESNYTHDILDGTCKAWNKNGTPSYERVYRLKDSKKQSMLIDTENIFDEKGNLTNRNSYDSKGVCYTKEVFYIDGKNKTKSYYLVKSEGGNPRLGRSISYFNNGQVASDLFFYNAQCGRSIYYYINGKIKKIVDYDEPNSSTKYGKEMIWLSDGQLISYKEYGKDTIIDKIAEKKIANDLYNRYMIRPVEEQKETNWSTWFEKDHKQYETFFINGKLDNKFIAYYPRGNKLSEISLKEGLADGEFKIWNEKGILLEEGLYTGGIKSGTWITYGNNGSKRKLIEYEDLTEKPKLVKEWYLNGKPESEKRYVDSKEDGKQLKWYENGTISQESNYTNGKQNGESKLYYENGICKEMVTVVDGKKEGEFVQKYENGITKQIAYYVNGKLEGNTKVWYENGQLQVDKYYKNANPDSTWTFYKQDGEVEKYKKFENGLLVYTSPVPTACQCIDSTKLKIGFAPMVIDHASLEEVHKWSYNFHAPIGDFYNRLHYMNFNGGGSSNSTEFRTFSIIAYEKMFLNIPDKKGVKLILNPCTPTGSGATKSHFDISVDTKKRESIKASLETDYLSIEFNPRLLHQWDTVKNTKLTDANLKNIPATMLFKSRSVNYTKKGGIDIVGIEDPCFTLSEIGETQILFDFSSMYLDLNPFDMNYGYEYEANRYIKKMLELFGGKEPKSYDMSLRKMTENFVGVITNESKLVFPKEIFNTKDTVSIPAYYFLLAGEYMIGEIHLKAALANELDYQLTFPGEETSHVTAIQIENELKNKGITKVKTKYDSVKSELIIYFYYTIN